MVNFYKKMMRGAKNLGFWDRAVLKIYLVVVGLFLATIIPALTKIQWWIYLIIIVILGTYTIMAVFKKR